MTENNNNVPVILEQLNAVTVFAPGGVNDILARLKAEAKAEAMMIDISTEGGRKKCASIAYKVARSKTFLDDLGKKLVEGWKESAKLVDTERRKVRDELDALRDEVRRPLTDFEDREKARIAKYETAISGFSDFVARANMASMAVGASINIKDIISECGASSTDMEEFSIRAYDAKQDALSKLGKMLTEAERHETEAAELARLRAESAEREQRAREHAAAERARIEAEAKAERERQRIERETAEREATAKAEAERKERVAAEALAAAERQRLAAIAAAERAERDRLAAMERAEQARVAAERQAKAASAAAVQRERDRAEAARKAEATEQARREADKTHRAAVNRAAVSALVIAGLSDDAAKTAVTAIAKGMVAHVAISY